MFNFQSFFREGLTKFLALAIALCFLFSVSHSTQRNYQHSGASYHYVNFVAVIPNRITVPERTYVDYYYPVNDLKPVNINYQLIKKNSLNLVICQRNC